MAQNVRALHPLLTGLQTVVELREGWDLRAQQVRPWHVASQCMLVALESILFVLPRIDPGCEQYSKPLGSSPGTING